MRKTIIEHVAKYASETPNKIAVVYRGEETSYEDLFAMICGYRFYLKDHGIGKGDVVVLRASQDLEFVIQYLSIHSIGAVVVSLEKRTSKERMVDVAYQVSANVILTDDELEDCKIKVVNRGNVLEESCRNQVNQPEITDFPDLEDSADILFTTGTTGASKGVELSHNALVATAENLIYGCGYRPDTVMILPGPLNHANAIRKLFTTMVNGSTIYILNGMINMDKFFTALDYNKGTIACCLPPAAIRSIFRASGDKLAEYASMIDFIESATSPLPEPDKLRLCKLLPNTRLYNNYGSSESASVCMYDYNKNPGKVNCIGKAMPNSEVIVVNDDKCIIESGPEKLGLIACRGDVNMKGYVNEPELTKEVLIDGVLYTNDIGYIDEDGFVYIVGRKDDVINIGGLKVAPTEVEAAILAYDGVVDCICIGVDDSITGKTLKLLVVMQDGVECQPSELKRFLSSKMETYKVPRYYEQVDTIKRTFNGKLDRKAYEQL